MNDLKTLIRALRRGAADSHRCVGCGFENNCGIHGCQVMKQAAAKLEKVQQAVYRLDLMLKDSKGAQKALIRDILNLLGGANMNAH